MAMMSCGLRMKATLPGCKHLLEADGLPVAVSPGPVALVNCSQMRTATTHWMIRCLFFVDRRLSANATRPRSAR